MCVCALLSAWARTHALVCVRGVEVVGILIVSAGDKQSVGLLDCRRNVLGRRQSASIKNHDFYK